ncbi:bifunctional enoyl-CoA hydratase/phosphate acetyltransferase [candidate division KSB1 bacterium]|nr:bifunctional enoyl-CoA hydratase/phosphate acetyltransferase [candidate division KSB1 bacterium]
MIHNFDELLGTAIEISQKRSAPIRIAVAAGEDEAALSALVEAKRLGLAEGLLIGKKDQIQKSIEKNDYAEAHHFEIIDIADENEICERTIEAIHFKEADIILKGRVKSALLLKAAFNSQKGLRTDRIISDTFVFEYPQRNGANKLLMITDGGFNLAPDLQQKIQILENAVAVAHSLGNENPNVAVLSAAETVNPNLQSTVDAAIISKMNDRGQIKGCTVDGPLALDNAISEEAAKVKGIHSPIAGNADILLFPTIEAANISAKAITYFANVRLAHATIGAKAPILIPSRNDTPESKLLTIALNIILINTRGQK